MSEIEFSTFLVIMFVNRWRDYVQNETFLRNKLIKRINSGSFGFASPIGDLSLSCDVSFVL